MFSGDPTPLELPPRKGGARAHEAHLRTCGLSLKGNARWLIEDVSVDIAGARRTMIMGANGAGKSLFLRLLHGLLTPDRGQVLWKDGPLDEAARRAQAMVFQRPVMLRRSVRANLRFALAARGITGAPARARIGSALVQARLKDLSHRPARGLSGGEQQRLAVVRAMACAPEMLFLDEPTASLDPASTQAVEALICAAHRRGMSIVMITHDAGQARRLGDDMIFMDRGRVVETGRVSDVLDAPRTQAARAWREGSLYLSDGAHFADDLRAKLR